MTVRGNLRSIRGMRPQVQFQVLGPKSCPEGLPNDSTKKRAKESQDLCSCRPWSPGNKYFLRHWYAIRLRHNDTNSLGSSLPEHESRAGDHPLRSLQVPEQSDISSGMFHGQLWYSTRNSQLWGNT